jgi:hypothetical protein
MEKVLLKWTGRGRIRGNPKKEEKSGKGK